VTLDPCAAGAKVSFQRLVPGGRSVNEGGAVLEAGTWTVSRFSRIVRIRYRGSPRARQGLRRRACLGLRRAGACSLTDDGSDCGVDLGDHLGYEQSLAPGLRRAPLCRPRTRTLHRTRSHRRRVGTDRGSSLCRILHRSISCGPCARNGAWSTITGLRRSPSRLLAGGFVHVPMDAASKATEWTLSRQT
jgi:hypothetical protein